ncbi:hypothetical protein QCA50_005758 [Cerrena zonata]|uniref:Telomerase reverse transcriptase n=1 Tax=Cerrena zonata TaxID=2478898 RepID=A0AAW0GG21_9APHY
MSSNDNNKISLNLLRSYYPVVESLQSYLGSILDPPRPRDFLIHETDTLIYRNLLKEAYVANLRGIPSTRLSLSTPMVPLKEIIERAQVNLLMKIKASSDNVLTAGYRLVQKQRPGGVTSYYLNTVVSALYGAQWNDLFHRIGEDAMLHLLTETSIFISLPNGCFCQMTGEPIVNFKAPINLSHRPPAQVDNDRKRKASDDTGDERPRKRCRLDEPNLKPGKPALLQTLLPKDSRPPMDVSLIRARMFYYRPHFIGRTKMVVIGLPPKHILNRLNPSLKGKQGAVASTPEADPRKQMENARHIAKYVFPREFGLPNAFEIEKPFAGGMRLPNFLDREDQIQAKGSCKTPKRVKCVLHILEKMIWRHGKCGYKPLLNKLCPSKLEATEQKAMDSSVILEMMSETSMVLCSQGPLSLNDSLDSHGNTIIAKGLTQLREDSKNKPRFAEFTCSYAEVFHYVMAITKVVVPYELWGCQRNYKLIANHVKTLITARRFETLTVHELVQGFSTSECDWLAGPHSTSQKRVSVSDALKRRQLLEEFLFWYFDGFLIPLIRTTFYVTESGAFRNRVLYFRQDDWTTLCTPLIERLTSNTFEKLDPTDAQELLRQRKLGFSFVRLLPKETGVRPIVNLRRKKPTPDMMPGRPQQSINQILQAAFQILNYEKTNQVPRLGASVFGPNEVYTKLKTFKQHLLSRTTSGILPRLYFVKVDVQACFDTIEQTKLLGILRDLISEDSYIVQRRGQVTTVGGKVRRSYVKSALPDDDHPHFLSLARKLADALRNTIFVDQVVYSYAQKQEILDLLEEHITENLVKIGDDYYRQRVGIPQGSVLSALLCSFFYGDLEKTQLKFTDDSQSVLLRLIDDYLFVTTSPGRARKFLKVMKEGHPEYGCFISRDKTLANFETDDPTSFIGLENKVFPWCGYLIDMFDLSVTIDYGRFHENYLQDSLTVETGRHAGAIFAQKLMQLAKSKSHIIFNDSVLNPKKVVLKNIYENFLLCAMKMHYYLQNWGLEIPKSSDYILKTIRQVVRYTYATIQNKSKNQIAKALSARVDITKAQVLFLGTHAFHTAFLQKAHFYTSILRSLEFELNLASNRRLRPSLRKVLKESRDLMITLSF